VRGPLLRNGDYLEVREEWIHSAPDPRIQLILERIRQEQQARMAAQQAQTGGARMRTDRGY